MSGPPQSNTQEVTDGCPSVPDSLLKAKRNELTDIKLNIIKMGEKDLPDDLQGHVFIIAPVGTVNSGGLPFKSGDSFLNGDGMIYRLDFKGKSEVRLKTRIVKPPDYYADKATWSFKKYAKYRFRNYGIVRFSLALGSRNNLSIAFMPMKFAQDSQERLLVNYDAGRHYEIDTETLKVVTPVGWNKEWRGETKLNFPFQPVLTTAHPVFDVRTSEMFTVNFGRSLGSFLGSFPFVEAVNKLIKKGEKLFPKAGRFLGKFAPFDNFFYLMRWDGEGEIERWRLVLPDGSPVKIKQCVHQIGVTQDYIVLMDTSFKCELWQTINNPFPENNDLARLLRKKLDRPMLPYTTIYIVPRDRLKAGQHPVRNEPEVKVVVQKLELPLECTHFLGDYDNPNKKIVLHAVHTCAWDVGEWIRKYDVSAYPPYKPVKSGLLGMEQSEMDISRLGRYEIDGETGEILGQKVIPEVFSLETEECRCTWGIALYAYLERLPSSLYPTLPPEKIDNIYWVSLGLWKDLITEFICDLYKHYKNQKVPLQELLRIAEEEGRPSCLFRVDTASTQSMNIADCYEFPPGHIGLSPQFVPRGDGNSSTNGYIVCTVWFGNSYEIWIFEAWDLKQGPQWKLSHPSLNFGLTLHAVWLPTIGSHQARYNVPVRQDYQDLVEQFPYPSEIKKEIQELFDNEVYPHFDGDTKST